MRSTPRLPWEYPAHTPCVARLPEADPNRTLGRCGRCVCLCGPGLGAVSLYMYIYIYIYMRVFVCLSLWVFLYVFVCLCVSCAPRRRAWQIFDILKENEVSLSRGRRTDRTPTRQRRSHGCAAARPVSTGYSRVLPGVLTGSRGCAAARPRPF